MPYSSKDYVFLFDQQAQETAIEALHHKDVYRYRVKTIKSGDQLECEIYPIWATRNEVRNAKKKTTREAQKNLNERNSKKEFVRKVNENFTQQDLELTFTYDDETPLPNESEARRDIRNYLRRIRDFRKKNGMSELKYVYVIEFTGDGGREKKRIHHHVFMSGMDRDEAEKIWGKGWANSRRLQPDEYGLEAIARYIVKEPHNGKRWCCSKNLKPPRESVADTKLSKKQAERLAKDVEAAGPEIFRKLYPGYEYLDCEVKRSDFVAGAYIYTRMHKIAALPAKKKQRAVLEKTG